MESQKLLVHCWNVRERAGGGIAEEKIIRPFLGLFSLQIVGNCAAQNYDGKHVIFFQESVRRAARLLPQLDAHHGRDQRRGDEEEVQELRNLTARTRTRRDHSKTHPPPGNMCAQSLVRKNKEVAFMVKNDACFMFLSAASAVRSGDGQSCCCCCWIIFQSGAYKRRPYNMSSYSSGKNHLFCVRYHNLLFRQMIVDCKNLSWAIGMASRQTRTRQGFFPASIGS